MVKKTTKIRIIYELVKSYSYTFRNVLQHIDSKSSIIIQTSKQETETRNTLPSLGASHLMTTDLETLPERPTLFDRKRSLLPRGVSDHLKALIVFPEARLPDETGKASALLQKRLRQAFDGGGRSRRLWFVVQNTDVIDGIRRQFRLRRRVSIVGARQL